MHCGVIWSCIVQVLFWGVRVRACKCADWRERRPLRIYEARGRSAEELGDEAMSRCTHIWAAEQRVAESL